MGKGIKKKNMTRWVSEAEILEFLTDKGRSLVDYCFINEFGTPSLTWISENGRLFDVLIESENLAIACDEYLQKHGIPVFQSGEEAVVEMTNPKRTVRKMPQ